MFGPLSTAFHEAERPRASDDEVAWYDQRLPRGHGAVLDVMCGFGRVLVPILQRGRAVHGVDASVAMIARCDARLREIGANAMLFRQDVAALNLPFRYAGAYIPGSSFQLIVTPVAAKTALQRIRAHLVPPAVLVGELSIPDVGVHPPAAPLVEIRATTLDDGARITVRSETLVDAHRRRLDTTLRYEKRTSGQPVEREDATVSRTWYDEEQFAAMLRDAGFGNIAFDAPPRQRQDGRAFAFIAR